MTKTYCDRCGTDIASGEVQFITVSCCLGGTPSNKYELCPRCAGMITLMSKKCKKKAVRIRKER